MKKKLIDADALLEETMKVRWNLQMLDNTQNADKIMRGLYLAENKIREAPAVDAAPVRSGSWNEEKVGCTKIYICSCCGKKYYISPLNDNYCASCGAKMDEETK